MDDGQTGKSGRDDSNIWWGNIVWRTRAAVTVFALAALALTLPPQIKDMLADLADFGDMGTWEPWWHALTYQFSMIVMALSLWYWARAVLLAWYGFTDTDEGHKAAKALITSSGPGGANAAVAFDHVPRLLLAGTAVIAGIATANSGKWLQTIIVAVWGVGLYWLLVYRTKLQTAPDPTRPAPTDGRRIAAWRRAGVPEGLSRLLLLAPFGWPVAAIAMLLGSGLFVLSFVTAFVPNSIGAKTAIATYFPGPSVALILLGLSAAPLTYLTFSFDRWGAEVRLFGVRLRLRYVPALVVLLGLMGGGAQIMNLHALRVASGPRPTDDRASLAVFLKDWAQRCTPDDKTPVRPVIVAVSGGASRAGLWAAKVLDTVDARIVAAKATGTGIFAVSSVSGGSLGAAAYVAMRAGQHRPAKGGPCTLPNLAGNEDDQRADAVTEAMRADAIGPALAGMLLGDGPRALAAYPAWLFKQLHNQMSDQPWALRGNDRAEALERAFERNWLRDGIGHIPASQGTPVAFDQPYLSLFYDEAGGKPVPRGDVPLWLANGTADTSGDRLLTAPFRINDESFCSGSGLWDDRASSTDCGRAHATYQWDVLGPFQSTKDVIAILKADVPISTAIDNTSRFPFLSPSGALTPAITPKGDDKTDKDLQIIDGGYFENEGLMTAMELANWLKTYGSKLLGRPVYPIIVQATSDAETVKERDIARCGNKMPLNPHVARGGDRSSQFLVPLIGLTAVRAGHSRAILQTAEQDYCNEAGQQAFFQFYLYNAADFSVPLNWSLSKKVADYIWGGAMNACGNRAEQANFDAMLATGAAGWQPPGPHILARTLKTCNDGEHSTPWNTKVSDHATLSLPWPQTGL
jgi:hypothetical protein